MFIKLTNAAKEYDGDVLLLNKRYIISVFQGKDAEDNPVTVVYGALKDSWSVKETIEQVMNELGEL